MIKICGMVVVLDQINVRIVMSFDICFIFSIIGNCYEYLLFDYTTHDITHALIG